MPDGIGVGLTPVPTQPTQQPQGDLWSGQQWAQPNVNPLTVKPIQNIPAAPPDRMQYDTSGKVGTITQYGQPNQLGGGTQTGQSAISNFVWGLESSYGKGADLNRQRNPHMVDYDYGQYGGFAHDYGTGSQGVDNYAAKVLAANPHATLGDFYSSYVLNTGNPSQLSTPDDLKANNPMYYANLQKQLATHGYNFNTPLSSLTGSGGNQQVVGMTDEGNVVYAPAPRTAPVQDTLQPASTAQAGAAGGPTPDSVAAQASKQMQQMMMMAALRGYALHPVPYDPAAILKVSHIYGEPDTRIGGLPHMAGSEIPKLQLTPEVTAISPRRVPGALGQKGPSE